MDNAASYGPHVQQLRPLPIRLRQLCSPALAAISHSLGLRHMIALTSSTATGKQEQPSNKAAKVDPAHPAAYRGMPASCLVTQASWYLAYLASGGVRCTSSCRLLLALST